MVQRIVLIKLNDAWSTADGRLEVANHARSLFPTLPGVRRVDVGLPADSDCEGSWDLSLAIVFDTLAEVETYKVDPRHRAFVDVFLAPKRAVLKAWNFEL